MVGLLYFGGTIVGLALVCFDSPETLADRL